MPVTNITKDLDTRSLVITASFAAPVARVWQIYADPRQLERIWGPPTYPATVTEHSLTPGGRVHYFMTSPEGEKYYGGWHVQASAAYRLARRLPAGTQWAVSEPCVQPAGRSPPSGRPRESVSVTTSYRR